MAIKLGDLLEMQKCGMLKTDVEAGTVCGIKVTEEQLHNLVANLGWVDKNYLEDIRLVEKADKLLRGFQKIVDCSFRDLSKLKMENMRKQNSLDSYDRIEVSGPAGKTITILYNANNAGGKYVVYDKTISISQPICKCARLSGVVSLINERYA